MINANVKKALWGIATIFVALVLLDRYKNFVSKRALKKAIDNNKAQVGDSTPMAVAN